MSSEKRNRQSCSLTRRDLLKAITAAPAVALVSRAPAAAATLPVPGAGGASIDLYKPKVFNPHQWDTIHVLSDLIIPADERTGSATEAGVPAFIDDWLNVQGGLLKTEVLGGLTWMDTECNRQFGHDFITCREEQQKLLLDRIAYPGKAAPEVSSAVAAFNRIRDLVLAGFYSSQMGVKDLQYRGNTALAEWNGCPESATSRLAVDYRDAP